MCFLALSHAPPALDMKIAIKTPETVTPARTPASICIPSSSDKIPVAGKITANMTGVETASKPGATIFLIAA